jgi:hypothetical protein
VEVEEDEKQMQNGFLFVADESPLAAGMYG